MHHTSKNNYPRAAPYRLTPEHAQGEGRSGGFLRYVVGAVALVLVTAAATVLVVNLLLARPQTVPPAVPAEVPVAEKNQPRRPASPPQATPAPAPSKAKVAERETILRALGALSLSHVYQGYLNIGLLADGVESEAYTKVEAEQMLATVAGILDLVDRQTEKVSEAGLDEDDQERLERIQELTALLRRQASALRAYWASGDAEQITRYQEARETTWKHLSKLLEVE
ncbi:MAG: hypothetical protein IT429_00515 [Gemmataceae bacterium]|nr:hypothetical protein [Gemmataceae bacterium]